MTNTTDTRSATARRFVLRTLGAGTVLLTLGLATAPATPAASAAETRPTPTGPPPAAGTFTVS